MQRLRHDDRDGEERKRLEAVQLRVVGAYAKALLPFQPASRIPVVVLFPPGLGDRRREVGQQRGNQDAPQRDIEIAFALRAKDSALGRPGGLIEIAFALRAKDSALGRPGGLMPPCGRASPARWC
jgi:hypothetical protein